MGSIGYPTDTHAHLEQGTEGFNKPVHIAKSPSDQVSTHHNSLSSFLNNSKQNSFKLDTIYYKTHSQSDMRTIINQ